jgi:catechol 2,3-dioxygenase-like lactoylglutathione lyase family enzyme
MKIEHFALNVADPDGMVDWYGNHLSMKLVRSVPGPACTRFLADDAGTVLEIYHNPPDQVPDYWAMDPLILHLAFTSSDPAADAARLIDAGASLVGETRLDDGSLLIMIRDPWGLAIQLCRRTRALLGPGA